VDIGLFIGCVVLAFAAIALPVKCEPASACTPPRDAVAGSLRRTIVAPLVSLQSSGERWRAAWVSNEERQRVIDSLVLRGVNAVALTVENDQLRKLIGLGSRLQMGFVPAEALHSTAPIPSEEIVTTITLTAGSTAGVKRYNPVVSMDGLVGEIKNADPTTSVAILLSDPDLHVSAMSGDGSAFGIVYPHQGTARGTTSGYLLELRGVPTRIVLAPGTMLYTSGLGGVFPRGIAVGSVVQRLPTNEVWTNTYLVRPAVNPAHLTAVMVLTAQRSTQGLGNVWGTIVNVDSATRRVGVAGDSLNRQAALLEADARRAALDSVRRATVDSVRRVLGMPDTTRRDTTRLIRRDTTRIRRDTTHIRRDTTKRRDTIPLREP
jgi:cell shape-determining protein MreC